MSAPVTPVPAPVPALKPVLVAVARDGSDAAVRLGAVEADRSGRPLVLLHVSASDAYAQQLGRDALAVALARAGGLLDPDRVTGRMAVGSAVPELAVAAAGCSLLVTERRAPGTGRRPSTSVTAALAAATDVPLLSVPAGWLETVHGGVVTTGIDVAHGQHVALRSAVVAALLRHATLRVVAATWRPSGHGSTELTHVPHVPDAAIRAEVEREVGEAGGDLCDVAIELEAGRPDDVLVAVSGECDLLVLGRHSPRLRAGSRLGPVARGVLGGAECPVLLARPEVPRTGRRPALADRHLLVTADRDL